MPSLPESLLDAAIEEIAALCAIPSPTGFACRAADRVAGVLERSGLAPVRGVKGSVACEFRPASAAGRPLALAAHFDTLGAMVRSVKSDGRLRVSKIGGYPELYLVGQTCLVHARGGKVFTGTFQPVNASVHVNSKLSEFKGSDETVEIVVDEATRTRDETLALGIGPGDFVSIDARFELTATGYLKSRHLDDKAGCGILLALARAIAEGHVTPARPLWLYFTAWEETGHGAATLPSPVEDLVSVDMGAVGDDLGCDERKVSICAKDSGGPYDRALTEELRAAAEAAGVPHAVDVYPHYGSDAEAALFAGHDVRHGLVGPGVYASHGYERTHRDAIRATLLLLSEFVGSAGGAR